MRVIPGLAGVALLGLAFFGLPQEAAAQAPRRVESAWTQAALPVLDTATASRTPRVVSVQRGRRSGVPLMIVGGALFIGGLVIDDDAGTLIAVAGLGIGAWGLYLYLR